MSEMVGSAVQGVLQGAAACWKYVWAQDIEAKGFLLPDEWSGRLLGAAGSAVPVTVLLPDGRACATTCEMRGRSWFLGMDELEEDMGGDLLVLTRQKSSEVEGFVIAGDEAIEDFLSWVGGSVETGHCHSKGLPL